MQSKAIATSLLLAVALLAAGPVVATEWADPAPATSVSLRWRSGRIVLAVSSSFSQQEAQNIAGDAVSALGGAIAAWNAVADIKILSRASTLQNVSARGPRGDGVSLLTAAATAENARLFPKQADSSAATTRLFFDKQGHITEVDIVLNPYVQFSTDGTFGTYDLQAVLTHELGHLLGLDHSPVLGSRMFERLARNGIRSDHPPIRALADVDAASVRAAYGPKLDDVTCCGSVTGKLERLGGGGASHVWLEEKATGRVIAATTARESGSFSIEGVPQGEYFAYSQSSWPDGTKKIGIGSVDVTPYSESTARITEASSRTDLEARFLGVNNRLFELPLPFLPGDPFRLLVGGHGLLSEGVELTPSSVFLNASSLAAERTGVGGRYSIVSADLISSAETPKGEYTLYFKDRGGALWYLVGALVHR